MTNFVRPRISSKSTRVGFRRGVGSPQEHFSDFAADHPLEGDDEPDVLRGAAADIEYVGARLGIDVERFTRGFCERADEIESDRAEEEPDEEDDDWSRTSSTFDVDDVRGMLEGLESDLKD
jgi:hypothetical protein